VIDQYKAIIAGLLADKPVAYHPDIAKMLKSTTACIFISQLLYWTGRGQDSEWVYKTQAEWYDETGLSRKEQETARKKLRDTKILLEDRRGQPARLYYRVDFDRLAECLSEYYSNIKNPDPNPPKPSNIEDESKHSSMPESGNLECPKGANLIARKSHTIYTENTTENTTNIVDVPHAEKCREGNKPTNIIYEIQSELQKTCGVEMPPEFLKNLVNKFGEQKIRDKIPLLGRVETENAPGFLIAALKDDYQLRPGRPQQQPERKKRAPARQKKTKPGDGAAIIISYNGRELPEQEFLDMYNTGQISEEDFLAHAPERTFYKTLFMA
jgi:hypothetical protein